MKTLFLISLVFLLSSCFELIEDIQINDDGSGLYKLTLNMSASKVKVKSAMSLDSIKGRPVPKNDQIEREINEMIAFFNQQKGIQQASAKLDFDDLILRISLNFQSLTALENCIVHFLNSRDTEIPEITSLFNFSGNLFTRNSLSYLIPEDWKDDLDKEDLAKLSESSVVLINRFEKPVTEVSLQEINISKSGLATMYKTSATRILEKVDKTAYSIKID